jgi:methyl-accepting chemotaxis protein
MSPASRNRGRGGGSPGPLSRALDAACHRIDQLNELTESSVLGIGRSLGEIVEGARGYAREARTTLEGFGGTQAERGVAELIRAQNEILSSYVELIRAQVERQSAVTREAVSASTRIAQMGRQISSVAAQSRLLSLNASIEAARIGSAGKAFGVIASEMTNLSRQVESTSNSVNELVASLSQTLPGMAAAAKEMHASSEAFIGEISESIGEMETTARGLTQSAEHTLRRGDECIANILSLSQSALSCLQFQDPVAQGLHALASDFRSVVVRFDVLAANDDGWRSELRAVPPDFEEQDIKRISVVAPDQEAPDAGEVLLF